MLKYKLFYKQYEPCISIVAEKHAEENFKDYDVCAVGLYLSAIGLYLRVLGLISIYYIWRLRSRISADANKHGGFGFCWRGNK